MRYSQDHKAQTYQRILREASARFRRDGIAATGLQPLMKALGLTHGGFYAHFASKQALVETVLREATAEMDTVVAEAAANPTPLEALIDRYLSEGHRDHPERGCPFPTLAAELGQRGEPSEIVDEAIEGRLALIAKLLQGEDAEARATVLWSSLVGALVLARSVKDPALSTRILEDTKRSLKASYTQG
ncbi:TetR/AcrR family transcriptional regulator [Pseudomonas japonica]|uniref:TetR/AcrR family transcriptional regulator n=1 Tax=Pseudomonas japonica TaxID=256466 RepID=UPI0015E3AC20|nr:TetR/AcrR family transcriptional regulator [Pseudomonas japonica]MBA1288757.1 TetR/AcrR family transcriptional regulator [Pseudomonas japonica]